MFGYTLIKTTRLKELYDINVLYNHMQKEFNDVLKKNVELNHKLYKLERLAREENQSRFSDSEWKEHLKDEVYIEE